MSDLSELVARIMAAQDDETRSAALAEAFATVRDDERDALGLAVIEAMEAARAQAHHDRPRPEVTHIRKKAKNYGRMGGPRYFNLQRSMERGDVIDPQSQTLCGAVATVEDMSWAEARFPKNRAFVSCPTCVDLRVAAVKAK